LEEAADKTDLDAMAQAAHRLKVSAASSGATELGRLTASIEQAARAGQTESAVGAMGEFRGLARSSKNEMDILRREIFGSGAEA
jgi:HPt (histidine-containing phosphotransfer) domain-containing protein